MEKIFKPKSDQILVSKKLPPPSTSFSPVTSRDVGISPQNFLTFSFNLFTILV